MPVSGASQWRHPCECFDDERNHMHSEVSRANAEHFVDEDRPRDDDLDAEDLREWLDELAEGVSLICCNTCGRLKEVGEADDQADGYRGLDAW